MVKPRDKVAFSYRLQSNREDGLWPPAPVVSGGWQMVWPMKANRLAQRPLHADGAVHGVVPNCKGARLRNRVLL